MINEPTSVLSPENANVPDVPIEIIPDTGHALIYEHTEKVHAHMLDFLGSSVRNQNAPPHFLPVMESCSCLKLPVRPFHDKVFKATVSRMESLQLGINWVQKCLIVQAY